MDAPNTPAGAAEVSVPLTRRILNAIQPLQPFIAGGIGGCVAMTTVMPIDNVKVRMQLMSEGTRPAVPVSFTGMIRDIAAKEGVPALYTGLTAAWSRMLVYGSTRIGLFRVLSDEVKRRNEGVALPLWQKFLVGMTAGGVASFVGNPCDLALVRMQGDALLPVDKRRNYTGMVNAVSRIVREEGVLALWRGSAPTVLRAMALNSALLASSDQIKELLAPYFGGMTSWPTLFISSMLAGVNAAVASLPFDMVKTRLQRMQPLPDGTFPYKGIADCMTQIVRKEGFGALYTGLWPTYILRIGPYGFVTLVASDLINMKLNSLRSASLQ